VVRKNIRHKLADYINHDVWSYGLIAYEMLTAQPLFKTDADGNILEEEEHRLCSWTRLSKEDLKPVLKGDINTDKDVKDLAKDFLNKCLVGDPALRFQTMSEVINHPYFARNDLKTGEEAVGKVVVEDKVEAKLEVKLAALVKVTRKIVSSTNAPMLFCVIPRKDADWRERFNLNNLVNKEVKVVFMCPVTMHAPRDENGALKGYEINLPKDWVMKYGPALHMSFTLLKVAFTGDRTNFSQVTNSTNVIKVMDDTLIEYIDSTPHLQEVGSSLMDYVALADIGKSVPSDIPSETRKLFEDSYKAIKEIAEREEDHNFGESGLVNVPYLLDGEGSTQYILDHPDVKKLYEENGDNCIEDPRIASSASSVIKIIKEGSLKKKTSNSKWVDRYLVWHKNGLLLTYSSENERKYDLCGVYGKGNIVSECIGVTGDENDDICTFTLKFTDGNDRVFKADSMTEKDSWVNLMPSS